MLTSRLSDWANDEDGLSEFSPAAAEAEYSAPTPDASNSALPFSRKEDVVGAWARGVACDSDDCRLRASAGNDVTVPEMLASEDVLCHLCGAEEHVESSLDTYATCRKTYCYQMFLAVASSCGCATAKRRARWQERG